MALVTCKDCGHQISDMADKCPRCGRPGELKMISDRFKKMYEENKAKKDRLNPFKRIGVLFGGDNSD